MQTFKILIEGYAIPGDDGSFLASPTTILVFDGDKKVLIDPGTNSELLLSGLETEGLKPDDIDILFLSHYHPDHFLNIKYFPNNDLYDGSMIWSEDKELQFSGNLPGTSIEVVATPGHAPEQASLFLDTKDHGVVAISQDVFWWEDGDQKSDSIEELMSNKDPFMTNWDDLQNSRKIVLEKADWIIPGHGKMFKNPAK